MVSTLNRCTMHEFKCPTEDCEYTSNNKKIIITNFG